MRNSIIITAVLLCSGFAFAQQKDQPVRNPVRQQPSATTNSGAGAAVSVDAAQKKATAAFQAEQQAKDKSRTQKQTTAEVPVSDTVKPVKEAKFQIQDTRKKPN